MIDQREQRATLDRPLPNGDVPSDVWDRSSGETDAIELPENVSADTYRQVLHTAHIINLCSELGDHRRPAAYAELVATIGPRGTAWKGHHLKH